MKSFYQITLLSILVVGLTQKALGQNDKGNGGFLFSRTSKILLDESKASLLSELNLVVNNVTTDNYVSSQCNLPVSLKGLTQKVQDLTHDYGAKSDGINPDREREKRSFHINREGKVEATELFFNAYVDTYFRYIEEKNPENRRSILNKIKKEIIHESLHPAGYDELAARACSDDIMKLIEKTLNLPQIVFNDPKLSSTPKDEIEILEFNGKTIVVLRADYNEGPAQRVQVKYNQRMSEIVCSPGTQSGYGRHGDDIYLSSVASKASYSYFKFTDKFYVVCRARSEFSTWNNLLQMTTVTGNPDEDAQLAQGHRLNVKNYFLENPDGRLINQGGLSLPWRNYKCDIAPHRYSFYAKSVSDAMALALTECIAHSYSDPTRMCNIGILSCR